ncbi:MAG: CoA transferase subunit A [Desulforhopalus sp.]|nr:CoA transferase subunit A [Desulforhopalus sp.]
MKDTPEMFWTGLSPDEARKALVNKDKSMRDKTMTLKEAVDTFIHDGDNVGIGGFVDIRQPVAITHEMIRHGFKDLTLSFQSAGMAPDYLGAAMMIDPDHFSIKRLELAYWAHEAFGLAPMFRYLTERGLVEVEDWSNANMSSRFKAGAIGLPFIPTRGPIAGDVARSNRTKIIDCPFTHRPIALLPASNPDVAIIHVNAADKYGNCIIRGSECTCPEISMASAHTIVTCEQLLSHETITSLPKDIAIPFLGVDAVIEVPYGAYPGACRRSYYYSKEHIADLHRRTSVMCKTGSKDELQAYFDEYIFGVDDFSGFLDKIGVAELLKLKKLEAANCERLV